MEGRSGEGNWKHRGFVQICFCTGVCFVSRIDRIVIDPGLAAMDSSAGAAAILARARRGRQGHLSG